MSVYDIMKRLMAISVTMMCCAAMCCAQITGPWHGTISVGRQSLPLVFNISEADGEYAATMDSPLQGAKGIPAEIKVANDTVSIAIPMIGAKYQGVHSGDVITGVFEQSGMKFGLALQAGEYIAPRPQTPQPPYPYETRDVVITNGNDGYELHGTLTLPIMYNAQGRKLYDAVVMVTGSGTQNRDEEIYGHKPFAVIAHHLAINGIASLRYDDRGYGDPEADLSGVTTATNATDAKAAIEYVRHNMGRIGKVGVIGHSEGGTIALILGAEGAADFVVSLAGSTVRGDSILIKQNERLLAQQLGTELTGAYLAGLARTLQYMEHNPGVTTWPEIDAQLSDLELPQQLIDNLKAIVESRNQWLDYFITYDPTEAISGVNVPVFAANGTLDVQVDSSQNLGALRRSLPSNPTTVLKEYPGLNHLMQEASTGMPAEYGEIEQTISPELLQDITTWIKGLSRK